MKLKINPLAALIARAEELTNSNYAPRSQDLAHDRKRQHALSVRSGKKASDEFKRAAAIEGMTAGALAELIASKPDPLMERENARRTIIVRLRAAKSQAEIEQILKEGRVQYASPPPVL